MQLMLGKMPAERQAEHDLLAASGTAWTFLRPPNLTNGPGTGCWMCSDHEPPRGRLARQDLARAMVDCLERHDMRQRAPFVSEVRQAV